MTSQSQEWGPSPANLTKTKFLECMQVWYTKQLEIPFSKNWYLEIPNFQNFQNFDFWEL